MILLHFEVWCNTDVLFGAYALASSWKVVGVVVRLSCDNVAGPLIMARDRRKSECVRIKADTRLSSGGLQTSVELCADQTSSSKQKM